MNIEVPPLRQSLVETMACEHSYDLIHVRGIKPPDTLESVRGTDIHAILAPYAEHCAKHRVPADYGYMDELIQNASPEVAGILETCRDHLVIDWENFFAAEISMGLDGDFNPTYSFDHDSNLVRINPVWGTPGSGKVPHYCLIADEIRIFAGGKAAAVDDYKSHPRAFPADTLQGKLYSLALFMHMPELAEVTFTLKFVRYQNVFTEMKYFRDDVPQLMKELRRERARQVDLHTRAVEGKPLKAHGGKQCTYCPCVLDPKHIPCPIEKLNPRTNLTVAERIQWKLATEEMSRVNNKALKEYVETTGEPAVSTDANGKTYSYGFVPAEKVTYPLFNYIGGELKLNPLIDRVIDWVSFDDPADGVPTKRSPIPWPAKLRISATALKQYLKAGKRADLHQWTQDEPNVRVVEVKPKLQMVRAAEVDDGTGEEYREYGGNDED